MGILGNLKSRLTGSVNKLSGNTDALEGICAACALVGSADGSVSDGEIEAGIKSILAIPVVAGSFSATQIETCADKMYERAKAGRVGRMGLYKEITEAVNRDKTGEMAQTILLAAIEVAEAPDETGEKKIGDEEKRELGKIAEACSLTLAKFL